MDAPMKKRICSWGPVAFCLLGALVSAQTDPAPLTLEELQTRLKRAQSETELEPMVKQEVVETYQAALERFEIATEATETARRFQDQLQAVEQDLGKVREKLAELPEQATPVIAPDLDLVTLERTLAERRTLIEEPERGLRKRVEDAGRLVAQRKTRLEEIARDLAEIDMRLASIQELIDAPVPADQPRELTVANQTLYKVRQKRAHEERSALRAEQAWCESDAATELLRLQRDVASRELALIEAEVQALQAAADSRRGSEADQRVRAAQRAVVDAPAWMKPVAEKNLALAIECRDLAAQLRRTSQNLDQARTSYSTLKAEFQQSRKMVEAVGLTESIGLLLRQQRSRLSNTRDLQASLALRGDTVRTTRMRLFQIEAELAALQDVEAAALSVARELKEETHSDSATLLESDPTLLSAEIQPLLIQRRALLEQLNSDSESHFEKLVLLDNDERKVLDETHRYADFIDERVLWIRTGATFGTAQAARAVRESSWLADQANWGRVIEALRANVERDTLPYVIALAVLLAWVGARWTMQRQLRGLGTLAAEDSCRSLAPTIQATVLTILLAAVLPAILMFFAWRLDRCATNSRFVHAVTLGLFRAVRFAAPLILLRFLVQRNGLAEHHFQWHPETIRRLRRHLYWFIPTGALLITVVGMVETSTDEVRLDTLGRGAYLLFGCALTFFCMRAFVLPPMAKQPQDLQPADPRRPALNRPDSDAWRMRLIRFGLRMAVAIPLGLLILSGTGYFYTALQLTWRLMATAWLLVGLTLLRGLVLRWITLERRRMAVLQSQELEAIEGAGRHPGAEPHSPFLFPRWTWPDFRLNLSQIVTQVRSLLDTGLVTIAAVGLWFVWADVTPALNILDQIPLWQTTVSEVVPVSEGETAEVRVVQRPRAITAANLGLGILLLAIAAIASRNVPGLVEVILLEHLSVDAGIRFATTCLVRYFLFITGVVLAFNQIGVTWNSVQWLVAAASVGLGFGLQEIFANFVSGIILLFERPMRVGDVITIGDTTGTVSRIRFRATTIVDGDRKELIVPNKAFITGNLLNWTLSDSINRVTIRVGVDYNADPNRVRALLLKIATEHPALLNEPAP